MEEIHGSEQSFDEPWLEPRRHPRYRFDAGMKFKSGTTEREARVQIIGASGMEVELVDPLWVGAQFSAELVVDPPAAWLVKYATSSLDTAREFQLRFPSSLPETTARGALRCAMNS